MEKHIELNSQVDINNLSKDTESLAEYLKFIKNNSLKIDSTLEKFKWLVDNKLYADFFKDYKEEDIIEIINTTYAHNFKFESFMSAFKFYNDYALKSEDKKIYYENYEDRIIACALYLGQGNIELVKKIAEEMITQRYQPATPTFLNAGKKKRGEMVSCFLLEMDDSLNSITHNLSTAMQLSKIGGGVALNLSKLRAKGESIKGIKNATKGIIPVMKIIEDAFNYVDQMGQRKGAGAVYLNIFHYDVIDFLDTKKINADEKSRIQTLSIGLIVPDKFIELVKENKEVNLFAPYSVYEVYGKHLDDMNMSEMYDELTNHKDIIKKTVNARDLLLNIAKIQFESGYPYIVYKDSANRFNPLKGYGQIKMSNLCTEIFQIQKTSHISDDNEADELGYDISCNLGSLNIVKVMKSKKIKEAVHVGMEALTAVSDLSSIKNAPTIRIANEKFHSVGLGAMNLHGYLFSNNIPYESEEAKDFANVFFMMMNFYSLQKSNQIAKEREIIFEGFDNSTYKSGEYFDQYLSEDIKPQSPKVAKLFEGIYIPTKEDWEHLKEEIKKYGLYHSYRLAIAPTQSISYLQNSTSSVMPITEKIESRMYGDNITYYPMPFLSAENQLYYKTAYTIDMMKMIDLIAVIQKHIDQGISTTLFVRSDTSTRDLQRYYLYAHHKGLKSLYYTRTKNLTLEECEACAI
jgi:ribonucleoside-diphosphate reductase alpha chain